MLGIRRAELEHLPGARNLSFNYIFGCFHESLVKLCRMIFLHKVLTQLLWNDTLVEKGRGHPLLNRFFKF